MALHLSTVRFLAHCPTTAGRVGEYRSPQRSANRRQGVQSGRPVRYALGVTTPAPMIDDDEAEAETRALAAAIAAAEADPRRVPHEVVRVWLLRLANGEFDAPPPDSV